VLGYRELRLEPSALRLSAIGPEHYVKVYFAATYCFL